MIGTVLIAEDEKMIRQGIHAMVKRAPVEVGRVIECKNGQEALELLKQEKVDLLITDIRMPKMDGITLVNEVQALGHKPKIIVISGYDEFSYAAEMLRRGVREYILKPIERDIIYGILEKLDQEMAEEEEEERSKHFWEFQRLRYALLTARDADLDVDEHVTGHFREPYVLCAGAEEEELGNLAFGVMKDMTGHDIYGIRTEVFKHWFAAKECPPCIGISNSYTGYEHIREAYRMALKARKRAFLKGTLIQGDEPQEGPCEQIPEEFAEQFIRMVGTNKLESEVGKFQVLLYNVCHNRVAAEDFCCLLEEIVAKLIETYRDYLDAGDMNQQKLIHIYRYDQVKEFLRDFEKWLTVINGRVLSELNNNINRTKINQAIAYINENYQKDLNMAVISNHVSMNYSLFSSEFKLYTGENFVSYLRKIRMEHALKLLEETDLKVVEISALVGVENQKHFMKSFKTIYGVSPTEYRKNHWLNHKK